MLNIYFNQFGLFELHILYIAKFSQQISEASKLYQGLDNDNKSFTLIHCWNILKEEDKWKAKRIELAELEKLSNKKKQKSRPRDTEGTNNDEDAAKEVAPETEAS